MGVTTGSSDRGQKVFVIFEGSLVRRASDETERCYGRPRCNISKRLFREQSLGISRARARLRLSVPLFDTVLLPVLRVPAGTASTSTETFCIERGGEVHGCILGASFGLLGDASRNRLPGKSPLRLAFTGNGSSEICLLCHTWVREYRQRTAQQ